MSCIFAVALVVLQAFSAQAVFQYTDCTPASSPLHVTKIDLSPNPIVLPGSITLSFDGYNNGTISHSKLHLLMKKKHALFGADITVPCIDHVGSCDYPDICTIVNDMDHGNWGFGALRNISREIKSMFAAHNIDVTTCPFAGGRMHVENFVMDLPHVPSGLSWFAAGDYYAEIKITDSATGHVILCLHTTVHLTQAHHSCSGLSCIIGKK